MIRFDPSENQKKLVYAVNALSGKTVLYYVMISAPNAKTTDAAWQIQKMTYDASDNITLVQYPRNADGNASASFSFIADSYASYTSGAA